MAINQSQIITDIDTIKIAEIAFREEQKVTEIYKILEKKYQALEISKKLRDMAQTEEYHSNFWRNFLIKRNVNPDNIHINQLLLNILAFIYGILGIGLTLKILEAGERKLIQQYSAIFKSESLTPTEKTEITRFLIAELSHEEEFNEYEKKYKFFISKIGTIFTQTSGGLVTVISTAIGISGVYSNPLMIGLTGLIVGLTGALNTVVGFYFFGRTRRKINEDILNRIKITCDCAPDVYLSRIEKYMLNRYNEEIARLIAAEASQKRMIENIIAEEEYGIKGSLANPMESALWAGFFKIIATVLPLSPYFFGLPVSVSIPISIIITLLLLSIAGSLVAIAAEVSVRDKVVELVSGGLVLSTLTYILGKSASFLTTLLF